jgi:hypothetical protein
VPLVVLVAVLLLTIVAGIALMPVALVLRYRTGTARRTARGWVVTTNFVGIALSTVIFLAGAAVTAYWVPAAFTYSLIGLAVGFALGIAGLALSRWEPGPRGLIYTPNRWLVLAITVMVTGRILFGFWRGWETWRAGFEGTSLLVSAGVAKSLGAGAVVLGYYLIYWGGVRRRLRRHRM